MPISWRKTPSESNATPTRWPPGIPDPISKELWEILRTVHITGHNPDSRGRLQTLECKVEAVHLVRGMRPSDAVFFNHWSIHLAIPNGKYIRFDISSLPHMTSKRVWKVGDEVKVTKDSMHGWSTNSFLRSMACYKPVDETTTAYGFLTMLEGSEHYAAVIGKDYEDCGDWSAKVIEKGLIEGLEGKGKDTRKLIKEGNKMAKEIDKNSWGRTRKMTKCPMDQPLPPPEPQSGMTGKDDIESDDPV